MTVTLLNEEEQKIALDIAWSTIRAAVTRTPYSVNVSELPSVFQRVSGAFVTAYSTANGKEELRGCIGVPQPVMALGEAISKAARDTVTSDPRFPRVTQDELDSLVIEVEVLSPFQKITYNSLEDLYHQITVGEDGLVIYTASGSGLLLPPVPVKYGWDAREFVSALCRKAWVSENVIMDDKTVIMKFQAQVIR